MSRARFFQRVAIGSFRLFGVLCILAGLKALFGRTADTSFIGVGLIALGVPHLITAAVLEGSSSSAPSEMVSEARPQMRQLIAASLSLPAGIIVVLVVLSFVNRSFTPLVRAQLLLTSVAWIAGLGVVHFLRYMEPGIDRLLAASVMIPISILVILSIVNIRSRGGFLSLFFGGVSGMWLLGAAIVFLRHAPEFGPPRDLTYWNCLYIRWGWVVLFAMGIPVLASNLN